MKRIIVFIGVVAFFIVGYFVAFPSDVYFMSGDTMQPTISEGEKLEVDSNFISVERNDVFVISYTSSQTNKEAHIVKRIVGLPNETVEIRNGSVFINGEEINTVPSSGLYEKDVVLNLDDNQYFVLGDNPKLSLDSRSIGAINRDSLIGRVDLEK